MSADQKPLVPRIERYLALCDEPEFVTCDRCKGKGYHHGFGEGGVDPDWCDDCGGMGVYLHPDANADPDELLREALVALRGLP